jgi:anti-sigma regulatory factor (Ser/Thr protein kinase)
MSTLKSERADSMRLDGFSSYLNKIKRNRFTDDARDLFFSHPAALVVTVSLLLLSAWGTHWLEIITGDSRPFTLLFLVPVAFGAAFFGISGGLATAAAAIVIALVFLFPSANHGWMFNDISDNVEIVALVIGTLAVAVVTGRLRNVLGKLRQANIDLKDSEQLRQSFSREVLLAVTGGILRLCTEDEIYEDVDGVPDLSLALRAPIDSTELRHLIAQEVARRDLVKDRIDDLNTAVTEASTNAIKHGKGGHASVWFGQDKVTVLIQDNGSGISPSELARATLERGFSTRFSLGMGYYMMIESVDSIALSTTSHGTSLLMTVGEAQKVSIEENILARYSTLPVEAS